MKLNLIIGCESFIMSKNGLYVSSIEFRPHGASMYGDLYYGIDRYKKRWDKVFGNVW